MADEDCVRVCRRTVTDDLIDRQIAGIRIEQRDLMPGVDQRAADRQQPERSQMLAGDAAAD